MRQRNVTTGLSLAIQNTKRFCHHQKPLIEKLPQSDFTVKIANTLEEREAVFQLAGKVYFEKGYIQENNWLVQEYDKNKNTAVFIIKDSKENIAATATLVAGGKTQLPIEKIFGEEINELCPKKEKVCEVSRLVISPDYRNTKEILVLLFNYMFIYGYHVQHFKFCTVQANPRHKIFYKKLLNFEETRFEKKCTAIQAAPTVFLFLPLNQYIAEVCRYIQSCDLAQRHRSLYSDFIHPKKEPLIAHYLASHSQPMTELEILYFGLT